MLRRDFIKHSVLTAGAFPFLSNPVKSNELPKVVLIGDSIRIGYQTFVIKELSGIANVWAPDQNCRTTDNIIYHLHHWIKKQKPDLVHMNAGLHDIRTLSFDLGPGNTIVKPVHYKDNLETIFGWIQKYVKCKVIWATTTPVIDQKVKSRHAEAQDFTRYNADVQVINKIAKQVADKYDIPINDLYSLVKKHLLKEMKEDGVHFHKKASKILGEKVADEIRKYL